MNDPWAELRPMVTRIREAQKRVTKLYEEFQEKVKANQTADSMVISIYDARIPREGCSKTYEHDDHLWWSNGTTLLCQESVPSASDSSLQGTTDGANRGLDGGASGNPGKPQVESPVPSVPGQVTASGANPLRERLAQRLLKEFVNQVPQQPPLVIAGSAYHMVDFILDELAGIPGPSADLPTSAEAMKLVIANLPYGERTRAEDIASAAAILTALGWPRPADSNTSDGAGRNCLCGLVTFNRDRADDAQVPTRDGMYHRLSGERCSYFLVSDDDAGVTGWQEHDSNPIDAEARMKRTGRWPDGTPVEGVDDVGDSQ